MRLHAYVRIWIFIFIFLCVEYFALNFKSQWSVLGALGYHATPEPGRQLSLILGWLGMALMLAMNIYILRKRLGLMKGLGSLSRFLDFHIFCGLVGPTCIVFHCNFRVHGLVAISFWSMVVSLSSGVVGRYLYVQLVGEKQRSQEEAQHFSKKLSEMAALAQPTLAEEKLQILKQKALAYVGINQASVSADGSIHMGTFQVFLSSLVGDMRLMMNLPKTVAALPQSSRPLLKNYALAERRTLFLEPFRRLMGYWHAFHTPFAIFMYAAAIIHIAAELILGVNR